MSTSTDVVNFRLPAPQKRILTAIAFHKAREQDPTVQPSNVNVSAFVRDLVTRAAEETAGNAGGVKTLLDDLSTAEQREVEGKLEERRAEVAALESELAAYAVEGVAQQTTDVDLVL